MNKGILFGLLRWLGVAAAIVLLFFMFGQNRISSALPQDVAQAVTSELDMTVMQEADSAMVKRLYGLNPGDYESVILYYPTTNMGAEELLIVKLKDISQQTAVEEAIQSRLATQKTSFEGYGITQYDMLTNNAQVEVQGNYILFVVNPAADAALNAFLGAL